MLRMPSIAQPPNVSFTRTGVPAVRRKPKSTHYLQALQLWRSENLDEAREAFQVSGTSRERTWCTFIGPQIVQLQTFVLDALQSATTSYPDEVKAWVSWAQVSIPLQIVI